MSAFNFKVAVTPDRVRNARKNAVAREPTSVVMAPFSAKSVVTLEDVPITKTAKRILEVINPTDQVLEVQVSKSLNPDYGVEMEWTTNSVPAQGCVRLELIWSPVETITVKATIQFIDQRQFKKDVIVILKSIDKAKTTTGPTLAANRQKAAPQALPKFRKSPNRSKPTTAKIRPRIVEYSYKAILGQHNPPRMQLPTFPANFETSTSIFNKENASPNNRSAEMSAMLNELVFTPNVAAAPATRDLNFSALLDQINFTPIRSNCTNHFEQTPRTIIKDAPPLWAMNTPGESEAQTPHIAIGVSGQHDDFNPSVCSTNKRIPTPPHEADTSYRRKLFELPEDQPFEFILTPNRPSSKSSPSEPNRIALFSAPLSPRPLSRTSNNPSPSRIALSMIREEETDRNTTPNNQKTYVIRTNMENSAEISPAATINNHSETDTSGPAETPLRKKFQSMRNLDSIGNQQKRMRQNQGSMPNLNDIHQVRPIENNRYFYQKHEIAQSAQSIDQVPGHSLCSSVSSMTSTAQSAHDLNFMENEILAESSRFNINRCHETSQRLNFTQNISSVLAVPPQNLDSGNFAIPRPAAQTRKGSASTMSTPTIRPIPPTPPRRLGQSKRTRAEPDSAPTLRRSYKHSPPKRTRNSREDTADSVFFRSASSSESASPLRTSKSTSSLARGETHRVSNWKNYDRTLSASSSSLKQKRDQRVTLFDAELHVQGVLNPDPFAATTTTDPFLAATMYLDAHCVERHELEFIKWLNALVTIPSDLNVEPTKQIDFGALFQNVRHLDISLAQSKDVVSSNYFTMYRLEGLRRAAIKLYVSDEMRVPIERLIVHIERKAISMRSDRDLHRDIVNQREVLELLHCFNPMWLRLGLEVTFGEKIFMKNNGDVISLSYFILNRLFRDMDQEAKHPKAYLRSGEYAEYVKKFTLKKMLVLLVFLDKAKHHQIVTHNPCLFLKGSPYKEIKDVLLKFASMMIGNIGDVQKELRRIGIVLSHKQTYLDEFDYAFRNLAVDLRDGVRLTKVMEIIALRDDLARKLRVPAISRLQRVHNVEVALHALLEAGYVIKGSIQATDIADGHREKTLSLLWQLIYSFRAPIFNKAAKTIQTWWRHSWIRVCIQRRIRQKREERRIAAALIIQSAFRGYATRKRTRDYRVERTKAATVIQAHTRRYLEMKRYAQICAATIYIQRRLRAISGALEARRSFIRMRSSTICIQRFYRGYRLSKRLTAELEVLKIAVIKIQQRFRAQLAMRRDRRSYLTIRRCVVSVQQHFRANIWMRKSRSEYLRLRQTTVFVQQIYRANVLMRANRKDYLALRSSAVLVQTRFRAQLAMRFERQQFLTLRRTILWSQQRVRALKAGQKQRQDFQVLRQAVVSVQQRWRAQRLMTIQHESFQQLKSRTIWCQQHYRATQDMHVQRIAFMRLRQACITIQRLRRSQIRTRQAKLAYQTLRAKVVFVQRLFRANRLRSDYLIYRSSVIHIQRRFREVIVMRQARSNYLQLRSSAICIQRIFRANILMRRQCADYESLRQASKVLQARFRAQLDMRKCRESYLRLRSAVVLCQRRVRVRTLLRKQRQEFVELRQSTICVQQRWRANRAMRVQREQFVQLKRVAVWCQRRYRANLAMMQQRSYFLCTRHGVVAIQRRYRALLQMRRIRSSYQTLVTNVIYIQRLFRANRLQRICRDEYVQQRSSVVCVQRRFRAILEMRVQRVAFIQLRTTTILLQRRYRAKALQIQARTSYNELRLATATIQLHFRSYLLAKHVRAEYLTIRKATIQVQVRFRAIRLMRRVRQEYITLRQSAVVVQERFRALRAMRSERQQFISLRQSVVLCQQRFRAIRAMRRERRRYESLRRAAIYVQRQWRSKQDMQTHRQYYERLRRATVCIQRRFRSLMMMRIVRNQYQLIRCLVVCLQRRFRARLEMRSQRDQYVEFRKAVVCVQLRFRGKLLMRHERAKFEQIKSMVLGLQTHCRGWIGRQNYQAMLTPEVLLHQKKVRSVRLVQKVWRGYCVRRKETRHMRKIRENIRELNKAVEPQMMLRNRIKNAVRQLQGGRYNVTEEVRILRELVKISREVPQTLIADATYIANFCYAVMAQAIRSEIDKEIIELCSCVILNLSRFTGTKRSAFQVNGLETVAQMLLRWCNKECGIFNTLCSVIYVQVQNVEMNQIIRQYMTGHEYILAETKKLVIRKEKMNSNRAPHPMFPKLTARQRRQLPMLRPDFGLKSSQTTYVFLCSVFAFDTIMEQMHLEVAANV